MKNIKCYLCIILCLLVVSCTDDSQPGPEPIPPVGSVRLTIELPKVKDPTTYAVDETDENMIKEIDVLVFKRFENVDLFSYRIKLSENDITDISGSDHGDRKTFDVEVRKDSLIFVIIANARAAVDQISDLLLENNISKEVIFESLVFTQSTKWPTASGSFVPFPMWGETKKLVRLTDTSIDPVSLLRSIVRIDVGIDVFGDPALGFGRKFKLEDIYVYNVMNKGAVTPDINDPGITDDEPVVTYPYIPQDAESLTTPFLYDYDESMNNGEIIQKLFGEIYITESNINNVCLVISGYYDNGPKTFYKIAFANNGSYLPLLRNHRYLVNIKGVRRQGYASAEEAYNAESSNMINEIIIGDLYELTEFEFNGQYMLGVEAGRRMIDWQAQEIRILVNTTHPGGWQATIDQAAFPWLTIEKDEGDGSPLRNDTLVLRAERNTDVFVREGKIVLKAGSLQKEIIIKQRLGSNCYLLKPGTGSVNIPVAFANADGTIRVTDGMSISAAILWLDNMHILEPDITVTGTGKEALIHVNAGNGGYEGNAVIMAIDNNAFELIWTWHVWVTDYDPNYAANQKKNHNVIFMDRNLGALTDDPTSINCYGLLYQWGRKDPFPGANSFYTADESYDSKPIYQASGTPREIVYLEVTNDLTLDKAIRAPLAFFTNSETPHNWHVNGANNLWSNQGEKTPYDPSPDGWKVPESGNGSYAPWYGYNVDDGPWHPSGGRLFNNYTYYPATGAKRYFDGAFFDVAQRNYVWSASPFGFQAFCFNFGPTAINTSMTSYRGNAFPVRCVKDED